MAIDPTVLTEARSKLSAGDAIGAFQDLRGLIDYPAEALAGPDDFREAFALFAEVASAISGPGLAASVAAAAASCDDVDLLYQAAFDLYEQRLHSVAATLLDRANRVAPGEARIVTELVANLEALLRYHDAVRVLAECGLAGTDPMVTYLAGFSAMMCGEVEPARLRVGELAGAQGDAAFMRQELAGMVARADALILAGVGLGQTALTAWHAVINGGLLLHESPFGYQEGMRGRYAYFSDSAARMNEGILRVQAFLEASGRRLPKVVAAPDRASRILAIAMAKKLELPLENWQPGGTPEGLVVAWDMDAVGEFEFLKSLRQHAPGQMLFAHASAWVDPFSYTPDLTTLLYQTLTHPWLGGALRIDPVTHQAQPAEPDPRSEEELAGEILAADPKPDGSVAPAGLVESIATALAGLPQGSGAGVHRQSGQRRRQRAGSPVGSNRFL